MRQNIAYGGAHDNDQHSLQKYDYASQQIGALRDSLAAESLFACFAPRCTALAA
jgi:hypothetical protein